MSPLRAVLSLTICAVLLGSAGACVVTREPDGRSLEAAGDRLTPAQVAEGVLSTIDRSIDPCQDFYQYACGTWLKASKIPPDRSRWGRGFAEIDERNQQVLRDILEAAAKDTGADGDRARLGRYYGSCVDETAIETAGTAPLEPYLREIAAVHDAPTLMTTTGHLHSVGVAALFATGALPDFKNPETAIAQYFQGGLGLPDRDYYVSDDERNKGMRKDYEAHVGRMLELLGEPAGDARRHAAAILAFETTLAEASLPRAETRQLDKIYNKVDLAGLKSIAPGLPWDAYLDAVGDPGLTQINVAMPKFYAALSAAAPKTPPDTLQSYLRWHLVHSLADYLPRAFVEENFAFFGKVLAGQKELRPRWKRCVQATDEALGEILGRAYVERRFAGDSKPIALEMIRGIEASLEAAFPKLEWMDDATRARATEKLHQVTNKIGYPDVWRDYGRLTLSPGDYFGNSIAAARFEFRREQDKVGRPVDHKEWGMTPPTVNAYYNPTENEMVFPAGIMQPPFFSRDFPRAMNYGGVGLGMGHELTHGFDDQGRKFDGTGQLREWWEPGVVARFEERAQCVESLYSGYEVEPGLKLNGKLTLGENIADLGGIKESYGAYKEWEAKNGTPESPVPGMTNDQLYFVGYAQAWCELTTPERARMLVTVDPHSPPRFRVRGAVSNFPGFAEAFACAPGTPMNPEKKCEVW